MTFTVLARDERAGLIGAATASKSLAVGNAVIMVRPGVGAVASQAWTNRSLRGRLLDALASGDGAEVAVSRIGGWDAEPGLRQAALLTVAGDGAAHTGGATSAWSGHRIGADVVVAGNLLTGPEVLSAMHRAFDDGRAPAATSGPVDLDPTAFADRLVDALQAGEMAGGDRRGRQSAAVVVATLDAVGTAWLDLRVDDHADPIAELRRLIEVRAADVRADLSARRA